MLLFMVVICFCACSTVSVGTVINEDGSISVADPNSEERSNTTYDISVFLNEGKEMWSFC